MLSEQSQWPAGTLPKRWRNEFAWLLSGLGAILDVRTFYYHLREECGADRERIRRAKRLLRHLRAQTFGLQESLHFCSPLGTLLSDLRRILPSAGVGVRTIRCLETAGLRAADDLVGLGVADLKALGLGRRQAEGICYYLRRRLQ